MKVDPASETEGRLEVPGGSIWYRIVGDGPGLPVVTLHAGPGYPSVSLQPLELLATDRPVVFYDQLGCGNSDRPDDPELWTTERFVAELRVLLDALDYKNVHLLGHSWGTVLGVEFYMAHPARVRSMVLVGPMLSTNRWTEDCKRLISQLPQQFVDIYNDPEATDEEVESLNTEFKRRHVFRVDETPESRKRAMEGFGSQVYNTMWGPNEFTPVGSLVGYDRTQDFGRIDVPVLYLCGRFDEATPDSVTYYASLTPNAEVTVFERSSHNSFLEETDEFMERVRVFLADHS